MSAALLAACALVLLAALVGHVRKPGALASGMAAHGVIPANVRAPLVWVVIVSEALLGLGALVAAIAGVASLALLTGLGCTVLFAAMTAYVHRAHRTTAGNVPCACGIGEAPLGLWVTLRAGLLAVFAVIATISAAASLQSTAPWGIAGRPFSEGLIIICATLTLGLGVALLPTARTPLANLPLAAVGDSR